jgi:hypothetical protein
MVLAVRLRDACRLAGQEILSIVVIRDLLNKRGASKYAYNHSVKQSITIHDRF